MRIIAGSLGGLQFKSPRGHRTHPMSERIRGALFNSLGNIQGFSVLDAFAGTGALAFECVSRGAGEVIAVEQDTNAISTIKQNIQKLHIQDRCQVTHANVSGWSNNNKQKTFDLVIADPPYDKPRDPLLHKLTRHVADDGLFILSYPSKVDDVPDFKGLKLIDTKNYGDAQLLFYRKI